MNLHITIGTVDDRKSLKSEVAKLGHVTWPVPKNAKMGDSVFFLIPSLTGKIIAWGTVSSPPTPSESWAPKYAALISKVIFFRKPVPVERLCRELPHWKYFSYARSYTTVPKQYELQFLAIVSPVKA